MPSDRLKSAGAIAVNGSEMRAKPDFWTEFSPHGYRRVGLVGLVAAGMMFGYAIARLLDGETSFLFFLYGALTLHSSRVALRKGAA